MKIYGFIFSILFACTAQAGLDFMPSSVNLGRVDIDRPSSSSRSITLYNNTKEALSISFQNLCSSEFMIMNYCYNLRAGGSCSVNIRFDPRREGYFSCNISASSSDLKYRTSASITASAYKRRP